MLHTYPLHVLCLRPIDIPCIFDSMFLAVRAQPMRIPCVSICMQNVRVRYSNPIPCVFHSRPPLRSPRGRREYVLHNGCDSKALAMQIPRMLCTCSIHSPSICHACIFHPRICTSHAHPIHIPSRFHTYAHSLHSPGIVNVYAKHFSCICEGALAWPMRAHSPFHSESMRLACKSIRIQSHSIHIQCIYHTHSIHIPYIFNDTLAHLLHILIVTDTEL